MVVLQEYWPLFKFFGTILCPVLFISSFATQSWVRVDNRQYGLWSWCFNNFTDEDKKCLDNITRCHDIQPGDSPAYFEAARVMACFSLVCYLTFFLTFKAGEGLGKGRNPVTVAVSSAVMCAITLASMGSGYRQDGRWRDHLARLGISFWLALGSGCVCLFMCLVHFMLERINKPKPPAARTSPPSTAAAASTSTTTTTTTTASASTRTTTTTTTTTTNANPAATSTSSNTTASNGRAGTRTARGNNNNSATTTPASGATGGASAKRKESQRLSQQRQQQAAQAGGRNGSSSSARDPGLPILVLPTSPPPSYEEGIDNYGFDGPVPPPPTYSP